MHFQKSLVYKENDSKWKKNTLKSKKSFKNIPDSIVNFTDFGV